MGNPTLLLPTANEDGCNKDPVPLYPWWESHPRRPTRRTQVTVSTIPIRHTDKEINLCLYDKEASCLRPTHSEIN
jgi:hypothetical protein